MRALVTGGAGFIGSNLVDRLLAEGHEVDVVDDFSTGSLSNLAEARQSAGRALTIHHIDISAPAVIELMARRRPVLVFHLAAGGGPGISVREPISDAEANIIGSLTVLEAARTSGAQKVPVKPGTADVVHAGGVLNTDGPADQDVSFVELRETMPWPVA